MPHDIQISDIAPDLAMVDFDSRIVDVDGEVNLGEVIIISVAHSQTYRN